MSTSCARRLGTRGAKSAKIKKIPLKLIREDERQQEDEEAYGQPIKKRRSNSLRSFSKHTPSTTQASCSHAPETPITPPNIVRSPSPIMMPGSRHSSTPIKPPTSATPSDPMLDNNEDELCNDLLQGLCEGDLSVLTTPHDDSSAHNYSLTHESSRLDKLMEDALFDSAADISYLIEQEKKEDNVNQVQPSVTGYPSNTFYGLPLSVKDYLKEFRGISELYEWQDSCLRQSGVMSGRNLIYSLPTSGGKTLVAEILLLQQILLKKKDVLFILPFVSIVQEKVRELLPFAEALSFAVDEYASSKGKIPPRKRRTKRVVYVATIEKANGLVNSLIEQERMGSLGLVVVDELHMLAEGRRGATLETCLAKVLTVKGCVQMIAMSATLSNIEELAVFLKADVYSSDFRPVELKEYIKLGRTVYSFEVNGDELELIPERTLESLTDSEGDVDQLSCLVNEVVPASPCLVFCPTRKNCENVALMLTKLLPKSMKEVKSGEKGQLVHQLNIEAAGICPVLAKTIPWGIAYHHSGLTADERRLIEEAYIQKILCVITCTSTLAAGVNLPAKRVIVRCPLVGREFMTRSQYKQMIGRAGRHGYCDVGESVLVIQPKDKSRVLSSLIQGSFDSCYSSLLSNGTHSLMSLLLSLVALKIINSTVDLISFLKCTLVYQQTDHTHLLSKCNEALLELSSLKYITMATTSTHASNNSVIKVTNMGRAVHKGCIDVSMANQVYTDLVQSMDHLVLSTDLNLLYLVVPLEMIDSIQLNWPVYLEMMTRLEKCEESLARELKISIAFISKNAIGAAKPMSENESLCYTRFYLALILHYLLKYSSAEGVWLVSDMFQCSRGFIQSLIQQSASFSTNLVHFTEELPELWAIHLLLPSITQKLSYTVTIQLVPLMEVQGMKQGRARQLYLAGIKTPQELATSRAENLCDKVEHFHLVHARKLIKSARMLLSEKLEILQEEVEEIHTTLLNP